MKQGDSEDAALDWLMEWAMGQDSDARDHYYHIIDDCADSCGCKYVDSTSVCASRTKGETTE